MCQAIRLYEAWHDAFACKQASSQIHLPFLCAFGTYTNKKEKPRSSSGKTILSTKYTPVVFVFVAPQGRFVVA